jgi:hypothetical protein
MVYVDLSVALRPLRLAFLVNPNNREEILQAIEINTFLWGGTFNPIIPVYRRLPKGLKFMPRESAISVVKGYIDTHDPDFIVSFDAKPIYPLDSLYGRGVVPASYMVERISKTGVPPYGIGLFELLEFIIEEEMKFVRRYPMDIVYTKLEGNYKLFLASLFGYLSSETTKLLEDKYKDRVEAREAAVSISNYSKHFQTGHLMRQLTGIYDLDIRAKTTAAREAYVFFMDASKTLDIIDLWNLRASGMRVFPLPKQAIDDNAIVEDAVQFIKSNNYPVPQNPRLKHVPTILKSRSCDAPEFTSISRKLSSKAASEYGEEIEAVIQTFYPRQWDKWSVENKQVPMCDLRSKVVSHEMTTFDERVSFDAVRPRFGINAGGDTSPRFANLINIRAYGRDQLYAEVLPDGEQDLAEALGLSSIYDVRFSKSGIIRMEPLFHGRLFLYLPHAEAIFSKWLNKAGWTIAVSDKGRVTKQMLKQLNGKRGINILALDGIVKLLGTLPEGKTITQEALRRELGKIVSREAKLDTTFLLDRITELNILRIGVELQCPICSQRSWYSISEADYEIQCLKCLDRFSFPSASTRDIKWAYRTFGSFSLPSQAYGIYTVLLAFRFFSVIMDASTTPIMSFTAKKGDIEIEADLALFYKRYPHQAESHVLFVECKTFNRFEPKDVKRMRILGEQFPGAVLVFASLNRTLDASEKKSIEKLVNWSRKAQSKGREFNPILILTATELFAKKYPPLCWDDSSIDEKFRKWYEVGHDMIHLADATQQLYLEIDGYDKLPPAK